MKLALEELGGEQYDNEVVGRSRAIKPAAGSEGGSQRDIPGKADCHCHKLSDFGNGCISCFVVDEWLTKMISGL